MYTKQNIYYKFFGFILLFVSFLLNKKSPDNARVLSNIIENMIIDSDYDDKFPFLNQLPTSYQQSV